MTGFFQSIARRRGALRAFVVALGIGLALSVGAAPTPAQQPPLLDRELFFGDPEISGAQLSPDGKFISFIKPFKGTRNIWVKRADEPFDKAKPLTADTARPIRSYFWSRDGRFVLYVQDKGGDENFNIYAVNPADAPAAGQETPTVRNLTDVKGVRAAIYDVPKHDPDLMYVGLNDRDAAWHDLYKLKISTGERTLVRKNVDRISGWTFDLAGNLRLVERTTESGDTEILRVDADGLKKIYSCNIFETCGVVRFHKDGRRAYMTTNKGDADLIALTLLDVETGATETVESDPLKRVDFGAASFSDVTDELTSTAYEDDRPRAYFRNPALEADYKLLRTKLPNKEIAVASETKDERLWLIAAYSDLEPGETYLFDRASKALTLQYRIREKLPRPALAQMETIRYRSSDGLEIPAYLTLPKGVPAKNLPLIVNPHGGPWARDRWGYNTYAQFLANRGYAVLQPNFRSSTGYGKKFLNAGNRQWGEKMQDDITWGVKHLVAEGVVDSKRVAIFGGSYGGYATLAGLAFTPGVYKAGVSVVGPSNLITLLNSIPPYWESIRTVFHERMGDPNTPEGKARLERQSPLNSADKITAALLVVQGANDPRVKKAESDQIVVALRERGFPVEYICAPDEGHGFARPVNNKAMVAAMEKFLAKHIGGRAQEDVPSDVAKRLNEIAVDVKTVALAKKVDAATVGAPKPASDLRPGALTYKGKIEVAGQTIPLDVTSEVTEEGGAWVVTDRAKSPAFGEAVDATTVEKGTLLVLKRAIKQGPVAIDFAVKDGKATGSINLPSGARPVNLDLGGPLFADGGGTLQSFAALPLAEGYATTFRNFVLQSNKVKLMHLKVVGVEKVTVPAGEFEAFKLEITSAEGDAERTTVWVTKDGRMPVKSVATLPQGNGAVLTMELTK